MLDEISYDNLTEWSDFRFKNLHDKPKPKPKPKILSVETKALIEQIKPMEQLFLNSKRFIAIFSHDRSMPIYVSGNMIKKLGFTPSKFYSLRSLELKKLLYKEHANAPSRIEYWVNKFLFKYQHLSARDNIVTICGIKIKDKKGNIKTICIKAKVFKKSEIQSATVSFLEIEDISHIHKGDAYWVRVANKNQYRTYTQCFLSSGTKKEYQDLFSPRELEVLVLSEQHTSLDEIANKLRLSKETVKRHRKNMLARSGMQDIPSLIHVCYLAGIF